MGCARCYRCCGCEVLGRSCLRSTRSSSTSLSTPAHTLKTLALSNPPAQALRPLMASLPTPPPPIPRRVPHPHPLRRPTPFLPPPGVGEARVGTPPFFGEVMPDLYRAPEVVMGLGWGRGVDVWGLGLMVRRHSSLGSSGSVTLLFVVCWAPFFQVLLFNGNHGRSGTSSRARTSSPSATQPAGVEPGALGESDLVDGPAAEAVPDGWSSKALLWGSW